MPELKKDALVVYKGLPAQIVGYDKKIDIKTSTGENKKVRDKDILFLHPGPVKTLKFNKLECDVEEIWTLLQEESVSLEELADFLYGDDGPEALFNAYNIWQEGLYFAGEQDSITPNTREFIDGVIAKAGEKEEKERQYADSITRLKKGEWTEEDQAQLREIENLALEQRTGSKVLKALGIKETVLDAHRYLIKIGYWQIEKNPHPGRMGVSLKSPVSADDYPVVLNPLDLTSLNSFAIDDEGSRDPDDAISLDGNKLWIHITDVASIIVPGSVEDQEASAKGSNLYLPTETVHMLPEKVTDIQSLGSENGNNTLSFMVEFDDDYNIVNREIHLARVKVQRFTYSYVEENRDSEQFKPFYDIAQSLRARRKAAGSLSISLPEVKIRVNEDGEISIKPIGGVESRDVVSEFMLLAGECAALFCQENNIPIPYATQQPPDAKGEPEDNLASMFVWRRKFKRGEIKYNPEPHAGLGLNCYTRATSPLRRYSDLIVNQQIRSFLTGEELMTEEDLLMKVAPAQDSMRAMALCERASNLHWKLIYLLRNRGEVFQGTYVEKKDKGAGLFLIEDLALETVLTPAELPELNSKVDLKIKKIDIPTAAVTFVLN